MQPHVPNTSCHMASPLTEFERVLDHVRVCKVYGQCIDKPIPSPYDRGVKRTYRLILDTASGLIFRFAYEAGADGPLHIEARHHVTQQDAITAFREGLTVWNDANKRFETHSPSHVLYWTWHASGSVLVITCFRNGGS